MNIIVQFSINLISGLHIGGNNNGLSRGDIDKTVIRNTADGMPYIPGSSLRGRVRSLAEQVLNAPANKRVGRANIHECRNNACDVCMAFGVTAGNNSGAGGSRVSFFDSFLTEASRETLLDADTDGLATEYKTEVAIDRVTSAAVPRNLERVPAGAVFASQLVYHMQDAQDIQCLQLILTALNQLQDTGLGGHTSRGYGQVAITDVTVTLKTRADYQAGTDGTELAVAETIAEILQSFEQWSQSITFTNGNGDDASAEEGMVSDEIEHH